MNRLDCERLDARDSLARARERFVLPGDVIYLDGNSLGAVPASAASRLAEVVAHEWGQDLIRSWNGHDWIGMPARLGARLAPLLGAAADEVIVADSTSINLFKLAAGALRLQRPRRIVMTELSNFPTDLYLLQGLQEMLGETAELRMVERRELRAALNPDIALLVLTHTDYKTGEIHDMRALNAAAHQAGVLTLWDLSHSAGAMELALDRDRADFAVGCGYKYLNGGPGAPAFLFVAKTHQAQLRQPLTGWMGHAAPFDFDATYRPADGMARNLCGTPAVLAMAALEEGLKTFDGVELRALRAKSQALGDLFLTLVDERCAEFGFEIACPRDCERRGSQISLRHPHGFAVVQALIEAKVIGDFRAPAFLRFGFAPLYNRYVEIWDAVDRLARIMGEGTWQAERFGVRAGVT